MADWGKILSRGNVEDRRSFAPTAVGGITLTGLAVYLLISVLTGGEINVTDILVPLEQTQVSQQTVTDPAFEGEDSYEVFASTVLGSNNELWDTVFRESNKSYTEPTLVLFRQATQSACGTATSSVGPHYCPLDSTIYLDETFFDELSSRFGAQGGDVAEAYVIAHEVGHHVQNQLGIMEAALEARQNGDQDAAIQLELQADCFAGIWVNSIRDESVLEPGEIQEAMDAAAAVGDDNIQESLTGQVNPETWTHGSSEQRMAWFNRGYESGTISSCNWEN